MKAEKDGFKSASLKKAVKELVSEAKKRNLIKPHTEAFKTYPVSREVHKGKLSLIK